MQQILARGTFAAVVLLTLAGVAMADSFGLVTGVAPGTSPGADRPVFSSGGFPAPGLFNDGQRLGGTPSAAPVSYQGSGTLPFGWSANEFGSLSYMFRRGSIPAGPPGSQIPFLSVDFLGGPLMDLDGNTGNGSRSLTPVSGQSAVLLPGTQSYVDLSFDYGAGTVSLNGFDASGNNAGASVNTPEQVVTVNVMAGTSPAAVPGPAINPAIDTRTGTLTPIATGVTRIDNLGYEFWQDPLDPGAATASTLGSIQVLGELHGFVIEKTGGSFPTLTGLGLGSTAWPSVNTADIGAIINTAPSAAGTATITNGVPGDDFTVGGNGGLPLTDYADLGAYLDAVVIPSLDPLADRFVYLESVGYGNNNSPDPIFGATTGYDMVIVAQSRIPEPASIGLLALGAFAALRRRRP